VAQPEIKIASPEDAAALLEAMQAFYLEEGLSFDRAKADAALGELLTDGSLGRVILATDSRRVVGYAVATVGFSLEFGGRFVLLDELYVDASARGRRFASGLLDAVESYAGERDARAIRLEVEHSNATAQAIYERRGFARHERHLMTLYLPGTP
jgi:ribosomal protein S18 acetylase RimI-like enzyme